MKMNMTQDKGLRFAAYGLTILLVLVAAAAMALYLKTDELEASLAQARATADKADQASAATRKKMQDELKAANAKAAALEQKQGEAETMKTLLAKVEPQLAAILEAAVNTKTSKPEARAAAFTGIGVIGQITHGANNEAALAALDRALAVDKTNCVAGLAVNLGGSKKIEVTPECQALLPVAAPAAEAKPATEAKPAAEAKPATEAKPASEAKPAPAGGADKAAPPPAKG